MRATVTIGDIEVAISVPRGPLEDVLLDRFCAYLGSVRAPACWISVEPLVTTSVGTLVTAEVDVADDVVSVSHPWFRGELRLGGRGQLAVVAHPGAVDYLFQVLWSTLCLMNGQVLVAGAGAVSRGLAHLFVGDVSRVDELCIADRRPSFSTSRLALHRSTDGWLASSTPFGLQKVSRPARIAPLAALWITGDGEETDASPLGVTGSVGAVLEHGLVAARTVEQRRALFEIAAGIAEEVPAGLLRLGPNANWSRIDELAAALELRRALVAWEQPELRARIVAEVLPPPGTDIGTRQKHTSR